MKQEARRLFGNKAKEWASNLWERYFYGGTKAETIQVWRFGEQSPHAKQFKEITKKPNGGFDVTITTCWAPKGNLTREIYSQMPDGSRKAGIVTVYAKTGDVTRAFGKPNDKNVLKAANYTFDNNPDAKSLILGRIGRI